MIRHWFFNATEARLRAGWRIVALLALFMAFAVGGQVGARALLGGFPKGSPLLYPILAIAATAAVWIARRFLDKKSFRSLGLTEVLAAWKDLLVGFALSGLMATLVFAIMAGFGLIADVRIAVAPSLVVGALALPLVSLTLVGYWEELVFRGYVLQNMAEGLGMRAATVWSCILFAVIHAANPHAGVLSTLIIALLTYMNVYGYLTTGLLWLPIGLHIGWNFFQAAVFGFAASGHAEDQPLISHVPAAGDWLSGGGFGLEGSVITVPVVLLGLGLMRAWAARRNAT